MSKLSIIIYITLAILLLLLLSHSPKKTPNHRHRRLKLRSNFTFTPSHHHHEPVPFDPLVAHIERRREDRQWEKQYVEQHYPKMAAHLTESAPGEESQPEWEDFADAEDYINDDNRFNVTDRLMLLFPKIDVDPAQRETLHRTQRELETHDKNHDGFVSFSEYEPPSWVRNSDNSSFGYDMGWWKLEHFNASDVDGDGLLNLTEFNDFLHPADSKNPKLIHWLCEEEIRQFHSRKIKGLQMASVSDDDI
ncbi:hypothetical protein CSA_022901 [Cucumis sativus]|uniref:Uncharacterized protein n=2 Tax=Cucumis sativus TaxID=3659 RepID=A0ACB6HCB6_CUCSA|nr:hypothetical protein CSA_004547 [Cucumis sativus]KAE8637527.1 hypothetical protein CSA_022901 [Cucumis sativus]